MDQIAIFFFVNFIRVVILKCEGESRVSSMILTVRCNKLTSCYLALLQRKKIKRVFSFILFPII